jgi:cell division protein FtsL
MKDYAYIVVITLIGTVLLIAAMTISYIKHQTRTQLATESGCEYLGASRDIHQVGFYNCNGSVIMKLDK